MAHPLGTILVRDRLIVGTSLIGMFVLSWLFLVHLALQMDEMDGWAARMMGMDVRDDLAAFLARTLSAGAAAFADAAVNFLLVTLMWAIMMVGMMLPSAASTILLFSRLERTGATIGPQGRTACFVAGYFVVWTAFAILAAAAQTALANTSLVSMQMARASTALASAILVAAGLYELTSLKSRCLAHCRSPLEWIPRHMRRGRLGALRMGIEHGTYCVGCCWALMLLLFIGGVMNLLWVVGLSGVVLLQKLLPGGVFLSRLTGVGLVGSGVTLFALSA